MKYIINVHVIGFLESLPSRERGLKWEIRDERNAIRYVAPLAGAWIEIVTGIPATARLRRSPRGSVD